MVAVAVAVFVIRPLVSSVVPEEMCTVWDAPAAMVPNEHCRSSATIEHRPAPVPPSIDQPSSPPVGSGSSTMTSRASAGPLLVTVIVKPMGSPCDTEGASATLVIPMLAPRQSVITFPLPST